MSTPPANTAALPDLSHRTELSITDFLTDGSLAGLCAELSRLCNVAVELRDPRGRRIIPSPSGEKGWEIVEQELPGQGQRAGAKSIVVPLMVTGKMIGSLVLGPGPVKTPRSAEARPVLERSLELLASTAAEMCEHEIELRHAVKETSALFLLASTLSRASGMERVLETAMDAAMNVLEIDAGSIVLFWDHETAAAGESEEDVVHKVIRNLSKEWVECPLPLSKDRLFDKLAIKGEIVTVEDVTTDPRVLIPDRAKAEGLVSFINAGLIIQGRTLGVIRLYTRTRREFSDADRRLLSSIAQQAAVAVEQARLRKLEEEEKRIARQLELAADVQRRMLPKDVKTVGGLDIAAKYVPSHELGGDFYDFIELSGHFGLVVGDVVGKGIAAALFMAAVRATLRAYVENVYDLDEVVRKVNTALCQDTREHEFVTLWYGVVDPKSLRLTYCSAGHEPTLVLHSPPGRPPTVANITELSVGGMVVGIDPTQRYQRGIFDLQPGDVLLAYTDGLTDCRNFEGKKLGRHGVRRILHAAVVNNPGANAAKILEHIQWELRQFAGLTPRPDDQTFVVVRVNHSEPRKP